MQIDHLDPTKNLLSSDSISYSEYGFISMRFLVDYIVYQPTSRWNFSLMNAAYSCTPPIAGTLGSKEEAFDDIQVITMNEFDENHNAGSSINDLIEISNRSEDFLPLNDFLNNFEGTVPTEWFQLLLTKRPNLNQNFQVKVIVTLSTGENYEVDSDVVTFL